MAEEKFELPPLTEEQIRDIRKRAVTPVDGRALAEKFLAARTPRPAGWSDAIERRCGFDPRRTLTELEGHDAGDGVDIADEAEVHALRHVPLAFWTLADIQLMLTYGHGLDRVVWLALDELGREPLLEADHYPGDLLITSARVISDDKFPPAPSGESVNALIEAAFGKAEQDIAAAFSQKARELDLDEKAAAREWQRLTRGMLSAERDRFWTIADLFNRLTKARNHIAPPAVLAVVETEMVYAVYRPRRGLEMMPRRDFEDPEIRAHLDAPDTFWFRRVTRFEIVPAGQGVRLRHFSQSAIENSHGIAFESAEAAKDYARSEYGVALEAWAEGPQS